MNVSEFKVYITYKVFQFFAWLQLLLIFQRSEQLLKSQILYHIYMDVFLIVFYFIFIYNPFHLERSSSFLRLYIFRES